MLTFSVNRIEKPLSKDRREMDDMLKTNGVWKCTTLGTEISCERLSDLFEAVNRTMDFCIKPDLQSQIIRDLLASRRAEFMITDNGKQYNIVFGEYFSPEELLFT